ncbi:predicted protein [Methanosarcina acetivorans C2A]|uniref:Uncharacterized protein n=1 Tax=Methanosarcina acetivorans (strain ATCC 35395 / DSM 2834 / JCM 12185 / C2A) TaxID=188937 RepID=Q8TQ64_METAC|nr:predicted protein [Methanosarcina acetivorans C2A]
MGAASGLKKYFNLFLKNNCFRPEFKTPRKFPISFDLKYNSCVESGVESRLGKIKSEVRLWNYGKPFFSITQAPNR